MTHESLNMVPVELRQRGVVCRGFVTEPVSKLLASFETEQRAVASETYETGMNAESGILDRNVLRTIWRFESHRKARGQRPVYESSVGVLFPRWQPIVGGVLLFHARQRYPVLMMAGWAPGVLKRGTVRVVSV